MRKCTILLAVLLLPAVAHAERDVGIGLALSVPDIAGVVVGFWPTNTLSLDAHASLVAVEGGVTGHIPVGGAWSGMRHDIVLGASAGWVHAMVGNPLLSADGLRFKAVAGYGLLSAAWDFRAVVGVAVQRTGAGAWGVGPAAMLVLARVL